MWVKILKKYSEVRQWFKQVNTSVMAIDTELTDINWLTMEIAGIQFCDGRYACYIDLLDNPEQDDIFNLINIKLEYTNEFIFQNAPFDLMVLKKYGIDLSGRDIFCTMTAAHLLDETQAKGLKVLAQKYLRIDNSEIMEFDEAIKDGFHSNRFYNYALNDVIWTWYLYGIFKKKLIDEELEELFYQIEMPFQFCLMDMKINGALIDQNAIKGLRAKLQAIIDKLEIAMYEAGGITSETNLNSPAQLSALLLSLGVKLTERTKPSKAHPTGQYSTAANVLKKVANQHDFVKLLLDYRGANSLMVKFLKPLPEFVQEDGRIRTNFHNCVAVTGRLSSSKPNLQQLPKDNTGPLPLRQVIIAPPGKKLVCADYSGQELRVLAHVSKDPDMIQAFNDKLDVHFMIANIFFKLGIPQEALLTTHPDFKMYRKKFKAERDKIKTVNFGLAYGKTAYGFAKDWNISQDEAQKFIDDYFNRFPKIKEAIEKCTDELQHHKQVRTILGRIRRFDYITKRAIRQAFNFLIQSSSADLVKAAAGDVHKLCLQHKEWDCKLLLSIHDELLFEINEQYVKIALPLIKQTMEDAVELCIPMVVDINYGDNYAEAKP